MQYWYCQELLWFNLFFAINGICISFYFFVGGKTMYDLLIQDVLEQSMQEGFQLHINGTNYCITPHFSVSGKESILEQFIRLLLKYENDTKYDPN